MRYKGTLISFDEYMNFLLGDCEEWIDDDKKGKLGKVFIRCNNVLYISQVEGNNTESNVSNPNTE
ncbi:hypothetical protein RS030_81390 [Cryptosporidium xiaoi]|uniref:Sm domain-containing protein n=1 Tax=Cryptosporidium xiaoi TaxID=659607 RepID=A0AAV9XSJ6_9CRYT